MILGIGNEMGNPVILTKIEGAERLIRMAVNLFFENGDMLSIHALSSAAHEVLHVLLKAQGKQASLMKDNPTIRPKKQKEWHDATHSTQNFLKHAARDHKAKLAYFEAETPFWLYDAIQMYGQLTGTLKYKTFALFSLWFQIQHKHLLRDEVIASFPTINLVDPEHIKRNYKSLLAEQPWLAQFS